MADFLLDPAEKIPTSPLWIFVLRFGLAGVLVVFYLTVTLHDQYTPDDTYIYLQYAKNISQGEGFSFNAGEPSYGVTGPLWALFIAAAAYTGIDPCVAAKTLDVLFASLTIVFAQFVALLVTRDRFLSFFAAVLVGFDAWLLRWAGTGMETSFAMFLVVFCLWYLLRGEFVIASLITALLTLVRPEGALFFLLVLAKAVEVRRRRASGMRTAGYVALVYSVVVMAWLIYAWRTFGTVVPNTFGAKTLRDLTGSGMMRTALLSAEVIVASQGLPLVLLLAGAWIVLRRHGARTFWNEAAPVTVGGILLVGYCLISPQMVSGYLLLLHPLIAMYGIWGMQKMREELRIPFRRLVLAVALVAMVSTVQNGVVYLLREVPHIVDVTRGMDECFRPMAWWIRNNTAPGDAVVAHDVGLLGYVSGRRVFDTQGLITPALKTAYGPDDEVVGAREGRFRSVVQPAIIIVRSTSREAMTAPFLDSVMTLEFPGPGVNLPGKVCYYSLYRVRYAGS